MSIFKKNNNKNNKYSPPDFKEISKERGGVPSIISENCECKGNIKTEGEIQVDGILRGNLSAKQVVIGETGKVKGNVTASFLRVCGKIEGDVKSQTIEMTENSSVKGNIYKKTISIEHGATIVGNINELENATAKIFRLQRKNQEKED